MSMCTRFAPSPTGDLHIGGARTGLFCYLQAKHSQGKFILRIEDTDRERSTDQAVNAILDAMQWLGLDYDGPYFQTKRFDRYQEVIADLLKQGKAYRCYCSKERLAELRETQMAAKQKPKYDGHCRDLTELQEGPYVIRFKNPEAGEVIFDDEIRGRVVFNNDELDDLIIARSDGTPTYNFTVVVDDMDMGVTLVIRGEDHINNTPRQINLFKALGVEPPVYAHAPNILGEDGKKLSKRHGATGVMQYRDDGFLPQALLNYLVRLGWSHGDQEIFSLDEMIQQFAIGNVNKAAACFSQDKLIWLNQHYLKTLSPSEVAKELMWQMNQLDLNVENGPDLESLITVQAERSKTLKELAESSRYFYQEVTEYNEKAVKKNIKENTPEYLAYLKQQLEACDDWQDEVLHDVVIKTAEHFDVKLGKIAQPLRIALTGNTVSPSIGPTLRLIGKSKALARIQSLLNFI